MISYKPFWHYTIEHDISKTYLNETVGLSWPVISKLVKNEYVRMDILERICLHFDLQLSDICEIKKDPGD